MTDSHAVGSGDTVENQAPWFEDFSPGDEFNDVPSITLTSGYSAIHQAVFGDRSRLFIDQPLSQKVTGSPAMLVNPSLVCNVAIGQSTIPSQRVMGNLFYRGLRLHRPVFTDDTLTTRTTVIACRQNAIKPGRSASGMVALEIQVNNQHGETVMLFWRCPMIPCRDPNADTGRKDDFVQMPEEIPYEDLLSSVPDWQFGALRAVVSPRDYKPGQILIAEARDTVTSAPEIVRMTMNMAMTHTDAARSVYGKRLVYGGHTISMAAAHLARVLPDLVQILAWYKCDHVAPVFEEDILATVVRVDEINALPDARIAKLQIEVFADRGGNAPEPGTRIKVLDWSLAALLV